MDLLGVIVLFCNVSQKSFRDLGEHLNMNKIYLHLANMNLESELKWSEKRKEQHAYIHTK